MKLNAITKWTTHHTIGTLAILGVIGYFAYDYFTKQKVSTPASTGANSTNFTGITLDNFTHSYSNASGGDNSKRF